MPYVKSIPVRSTVHKMLKYILNPDKTEGLLYTASINCMTSRRIIRNHGGAWFHCPARQVPDAESPESEAGDPAGQSR